MTDPQGVLKALKDVAEPYAAGLTKRCSGEVLVRGAQSPIDLSGLEYTLLR